MKHWLLTLVLIGTAASANSSFSTLQLLLEIGTVWEQAGTMRPEKNPRPSGRRFRERLARDGQLLQRQVRLLAESSGIRYSDLGAGEGSPLIWLKPSEGLSGTAFEDAFLDSMVEVTHLALLHLDQPGIRSHPDPKLRHLVRRWFPILVQHSTIARRLTKLTARQSHGNS